jgi:hypothetical protein
MTNILLFTIGKFSKTLNCLRGEGISALFKSTTPLPRLPQFTSLGRSI